MAKLQRLRMLYPCTISAYMETELGIFSNAGIRQRVTHSFSRNMGILVTFPLLSVYIRSTCLQHLRVSPTSRISSQGRMAHLETWGHSAAKSCIKRAAQGIMMRPTGLAS